MKNIIRKIKRLFGKYETGYVYWVKMSDIVIMPQFKIHPPKFDKMSHKWNYFKKNGEFESPIKLMRNFTLIDGYTGYCIAEKEGLKEVPVYFVD